MNALASAPEPSIRLILEVVSELTGVSVTALRSKRRDRDVSLARAIACWTARQLTSLSFPEIAVEMGGRDHTTVRDGALRVDALAATHPDLAERIDQVMGALAALAASGAATSQMSPEVDGGAVAERILAHPHPERAAITASTSDVVALALRVAQLDRVASLAAEYLAAEAADLDWSERRISAADLPAMNAADTQRALTRETLAETLAALGYVTFENQEKTDANAS